MSAWSTRRIHKLFEFTQSRNYLEIGVENGLTFLKVDADLKVGVDPQFLFDTGPHSSKTTQFYSMTSDRFFANYAEDTFFDVIFLDGLHVFDQTYRDLVNALDVLSPGGFLLIDDVWPIDHLSFLTDRAKTIELRKKEEILRGNPNPQENGLWHGDIFKIVPMIHDYHKTLQYRTVMDGNPQTIVWFDQHEYRQSPFDSIKEICEIDYPKALDHMELLRIGTEEQVWEHIKASQI